MMTPRLSLSIDSWLSLLLCLLVVGLPRVGLAAQDAPLASPRLALSGPLAEAESSPESEQSWHEESPRYRAPLGLRLLTEAGAGLVTSPVVGLAGLFLGSLVCTATGGGGAFLGCLTPMIFGGLLGLAEGYALGVWWGGEVVGGDGNLLLTLLGGALGTALSVVLIQATNVSAQGLSYTVPLLIILGSHLGYELFQRAPPEVSSRPGIQPLVSFSSRGALLGLGGRF